MTTGRPILCSCACYCYWNQSIDLLYEEVPMNISLATICPKIKIWKYVTFFYKVKKIDAGSLWPTKATQIEDGLPVLRLIHTLTSLWVVFSMSTLYFKLAIFLDSAAKDWESHQQNIILSSNTPIISLPLNFAYGLGGKSGLCLS